MGDVCSFKVAPVELANISETVVSIVGNEIDSVDCTSDFVSLVSVVPSLVIEVSDRVGDDCSYELLSREDNVLNWLSVVSYNRDVFHDSLAVECVEENVPVDSDTIDDCSDDDAHGDKAAVALEA